MSAPGLPWYYNWWEAMTLYPMPEATAGQIDTVFKSVPEEFEDKGELKAVEVLEDYQPDPEIQRLIQESLEIVSQT